MKYSESAITLSEAIRQKIQEAPTPDHASLEDYVCNSLLQKNSIPEVSDALSHAIENGHLEVLTFTKKYLMGDRSSLTDYQKDHIKQAVTEALAMYIGKTGNVSLLKGMELTEPMIISMVEEAVKVNQQEVLFYLLEQEPIASAQVLKEAVTRGNVSFIQACLEKGYLDDLSQEEKDDVLIRASEHGQREIAMLIGDYATKKAQATSEVLLAIMESKPDALKKALANRLLDQRACNDIFVTAAKKGSEEMINILFKDKRFDPTVYGGAILQEMYDRAFLKTLTLMLQDEWVKVAYEESKIEDGDNFEFTIEYIAKSAIEHNQVDIIKTLMEHEKINVLIDGARKEAHPYLLEAICEILSPKNLDMLRLVLGDEKLTEEEALRMKAVVNAKSVEYRNATQKLLLAQISIGRINAEFLKAVENCNFTPQELVAIYVQYNQQTLLQQEIQNGHIASSAVLFEAVKQQKPSLVTFAIGLHGHTLPLFKEWDNAWLEAAKNNLAPLEAVLEKQLPFSMIQREQLLCLAAEKGWGSMVSLCLKDKRFTSEENDNKVFKKKAFRIAFENGQTHIVKLLLQDDRVRSSLDIKPYFDKATKAVAFGMAEVLIREGKIDPVEIRYFEKAAYKATYRYLPNYLSIAHLLLQESKFETYAKRDEVLQQIHGNLSFIKLALVELTEKARKDVVTRLKTLREEKYDNPIQAEEDAIYQYLHIPTQVEADMTLLAALLKKKIAPELALPFVENAVKEGVAETQVEGFANSIVKHFGAPFLEHYPASLLYAGDLLRKAAMASKSKDLGMPKDMLTAVVTHSLGMTAEALSLVKEAYKLANQEKKDWIEREVDFQAHFLTLLSDASYYTPFKSPAPAVAPAAETPKPLSYKVKEQDGDQVKEWKSLMDGFTAWEAKVKKVDPEKWKENDKDKSLRNRFGHIYSPDTGAVIQRLIDAQLDRLESLDQRLEQLQGGRGV